MKKVVFAIFSMLPLLVQAHVGADAGAHHDASMLQGFTHPFTGFDHLAAMLTVGVWSVLSFRHRTSGMWFVPASFAALLLLGGIAGVSGMSLPAVEPMIALSLLVLGLLVAGRVRMPLAAGAGIVGAFAIFHGLAHGSELPAAALGGMVAGTLLLHLAGMALGRFVLERHVWLPRIAGLLVAAFGLNLLVS